MGRTPATRPGVHHSRIGNWLCGGNLDRAQSYSRLDAIVALQAVLLGDGFVAMNTGEREEDRVESIVVDSSLERHEAYAEQFVWATAITLLASALVLVSQRQTSSRVCQRAI